MDETIDIVKTISFVIGGLALFLLGMKNMSDGMQGVAGSKLRHMIASVTDNRFKACLTGAGVTGIIQSSSVTSVMVISMVTAGLMSLKPAIGVILGADIGTTVTAWIVALNVTKYGLPLLGLATFAFLFTQKDRIRYTALLVMGLGMVFYGLELMQTGMEPLAALPEVKEWFKTLNPNTIWGLLKCVLLGSTVTAIMQSSSATVGITISMANTGFMTFDTAAALVLGQNIGAAMPAILASLGANRAGVRVAWAHTLTKIIGVLVIIPFFTVYVKLVKLVSPEGISIANEIALAHSMFNVILVLLFLPLVTPFIKLLMLICPESEDDGIPHLCFFDARLLSTPVLALRQSEHEILRMADICAKMLDDLKENWNNEDRDPDREQAIFKSEDNLDQMQREIVTFLSQILTSEMTQDQMNDARTQLRITGEYESVGDYIAALQKLIIRSSNQEVKFSEVGKSQILSLHNQVTDYLSNLRKVLLSRNAEQLLALRTASDRFTGNFKEYRKQSMDRLANKVCSPVSCVYLLDAMLDYRKIKDHGLNIAEALSGGK